MNKTDFLIEIGTEELPPKALSKLSAAFSDGILNRLSQAKLNIESHKSFATPRRLALLVQGLDEQQQDQEIARKGPALKAAYDKDGNPTKAAEGFARSCGTTVDNLDKLETDKGSWLFYKLQQKGKAAAELLPEIIQQSLDTLPIPKRMRWGANKTEFVRPVHWVLALIGDSLLKTKILDIESATSTRGHRFHAPSEIQVTSPADYERILSEKGKVIADFSVRKELIRKQVMNTATDNNGEAIIDEDLLDEVTGLVEFPVAIAGGFDTEFLEVPQEALISSMQDHQKYFPVVNNSGKLLPLFITISNVDTTNPEVVKQGNERVIRPRLADASFFWNQDKKRRLENNLERLKSVVFQNKLGSIYDKSARAADIAATIANTLNLSQETVTRAVMLSKCDLLTDMVGEFPELQGIMGKYYALNDKEGAAVAQAIEEHYQPRFAGDILPSSDISAIAAIADRIDTLSAIFAIGLLPTGDKDPFALRRAALGLIRILIEKGYDINLKEFLQKAISAIPGEINREETLKNVTIFIMDRLKGYYLEKGVSASIFEAVLSVEPQELTDFDKRIQACTGFADNPAAESLAAANKRIRNILKKIEFSSETVIDEHLLAEDAEKALFTELEQVATKVEPLLAEHKYTEALTELAAVKETVDTFFDNVMVMAEDEKVKLNRIAMLGKLNNLFMQVADISLL